MSKPLNMQSVWAMSCTAKGREGKEDAAAAEERSCQLYFKVANPLVAVHYCRALLECPTTLSFFVIKQHAHLFWKHISSWS